MAAEFAVVNRRRCLQPYICIVEKMTFIAAVNCYQVLHGYV